MLEFRDYQKQIINNAVNVINIHGFVYLAMEVRTGKTLTALGTAMRVGCRNLLFVTKKKAMSSISADYELLSPGYAIKVINYESLHKVEDPSVFDFIVIDEAHSLGAFPKPSGRAKKVAEIIRKNRPRVILL